MQQVALQQTRTVIREKHDYYTALERNGFKMPIYKSNFVYSDVLVMIRENRIYCPKYAELTLRPCPNPPPQLAVRDELINVIQQNIPRVDV